MSCEKNENPSADQNLSQLKSIFDMKGFKIFDPIKNGLDGGRSGSVGDIGAESG